MSKKERTQHPTESSGLHGFYRVNIVEQDGSVSGDSGWHHNLITTDGLSGYITQLFLSAAGSSYVNSLHLGSLQSGLASDASSLPGEFAKSMMRSVATQSTVRAASNAGDTARYLATFASNVLSNPSTIACAGLYATSGANSIFCGGSFASSTVGSTQAVNCSYDVVFLASTS